MASLSPDQYYTVASPAEGSYKDRGSKFLAYVFSIQSKSEAENLLQKVRANHPKARHVCYAFTVGLDEKYVRTNDDGEPSGTAGKPIMNVILSHHLDNILVAVVRYFGGKKLGTSGLIKAYKSSCIAAFNNSKKVMVYIEDHFTIKTSYATLPKVLHFLKSKHIQITEKILEISPVIRISVRKSKRSEMLSQLEKVFLLDFDPESGILYIKSNLDA